MSRNMRIRILILMLVGILCVLSVAVFAEGSTTQGAGELVGQLAEDPAGTVKTVGRGLWDKLHNYFGDDFAVTQYLDRAVTAINSVSNEHFNAWLFVIGLLCIPVCLAGYRIFKCLIALCGLGIGGLLGMLLANYINDNIHVLPALAIWLIAIGIGLIGALIAFKICKVGIFLGGAVGGLLLGNILDTLISTKIHTLPGWVSLAIIIGVGLLVGFLTTKLVRPFLILGTAGVGAWYAGQNLPGAFGNANKIVFTILVIVLFVVGVLVQFKTPEKKKNK